MTCIVSNSITAEHACDLEKRRAARALLMFNLSVDFSWFQGVQFGGPSADLINANKYVSQWLGICVHVSRCCGGVSVRQNNRYSDP